MHNRLTGTAVRLVGLLAVIALWTGGVWAACEWEWTKNQDWATGAGDFLPTPEDQLNRAYEIERSGEFMEAARQYFLVVENFPDSQEASVGLQRLALCLFNMGDYYTSYRAVEQVIETYPDAGSKSDFVKIELKIAKDMLETEAPDPADRPARRAHAAAIRQAIAIVESVIGHDPDGPIAAEAYCVKGEAFLRVGDYQNARLAFRTVRDTFPRSEHIERARLGIVHADALQEQALSDLTVFLQKVMHDFL